jgi:iron complex transport system ATP-binding protein
LSPAIATRQLSCGYQGRAVLEDLNFDLMAGSVVALLGPNGSGKSTLLKTLSKTLPALGGEVFVEGDPLASLGYRELARRLAYVPQQETHVFAFTVREVVLMGRLPHSDRLRETAEDYRAAEAAMVAADCHHLADRPVTELSGGEGQRVLIARALAQETRLLLLDEPTAHLDVSHQVTVGRLLRDLAASGYAVLVAVHDLNWASTFADAGFLLHGNRIALDAPIADILRSDLLEQAYGVKFSQTVDREGVVRVYPKIDMESHESHAV